jgi:hypothetical protein
MIMLYITKDSPQQLNDDYFIYKKRFTHQSGVEPEIEEIHVTAEAEAFTDLSIDTDEDENMTPWNGPKNSFVVLAQPAPVDIQTCGTVARTQIEEYMHTVENSISEQPILCAYTSNIRQHPEDPNDQGFQDGQSRRVRHRTDEGATAVPVAVAHEVNETQDATDWQQYMYTHEKRKALQERIALLLFFFSNHT